MRTFPFSWVWVLVFFLLLPTIGWQCLQLNLFPKSAQNDPIPVVVCTTKKGAQNYHEAGLFVGKEMTDNVLPLVWSYDNTFRAFCARLVLPAWNIEYRVLFLQKDGAEGVNVFRDRADKRELLASFGLNGKNYFSVCSRKWGWGGVLREMRISE